MDAVSSCSQSSQKEMINSDGWSQCPRDMGILKKSSESPSSNPCIAYLQLVRVTEILDAFVWILGSHGISYTLPAFIDNLIDSVSMSVETEHSV